MDKCLFSTYGVCIEHPVSWRIFIDPKTGFNQESGFIRFEDYAKKHGAQISLSINWQSAESDPLTFAQNYCSSIEEQYKRQFKKKALKLRKRKNSEKADAPAESDYVIEHKDVIRFNGMPAAFVVSQYIASLGLVKSAKDKAVRIMQLAFYDADSRRAVVSSIMGIPDRIVQQEEFLKELVFSAHCIPALKDIAPAFPLTALEAAAGEEPEAAAVNL